MTRLQDNRHDGAGVPDPETFDPEEADVEPRLQARSRFSAALASNGYDGALVLAREHVDDLDARHLRIIDHLAEHAPGSVRALAEDLGADKGTISRALTPLAELGVVELVEDGRAKRPILAHEHVFVEPLV